jgi:hypothetical protein
VLRAGNYDRNLAIPRLGNMRTSFNPPFETLVGSWSTSDGNLTRFYTPRYDLARRSVLLEHPVAQSPDAVDGDFDFIAIG